MKYSIWIIPQEPIYSRIKEAIDHLSEEYKGPKFEPHMTLLEGNLSGIEEKAKKLVIGLSKLELTLGPVSFSTTYFQSVFVRVSSTAKLLELNLEAKKLFDIQNDVFMPHMSLLYGNHDMITREKAASTVDLPSLSFIADKLAVIQTASDDPKDWKVIATIPLEK